MNRLALIAVLLSVACSSELPPTASSDPATKPPAPGPLAALLIVSDPGLRPDSSAASTAASSGGVTVVYVSLPPGSLPYPASVRIMNVRTGATASPAVVEGGFDPIAILAAAGDTLDVAVTNGNGVTNDTRVAAVRARPPRVVRTNPPKGQTDVPLNAVIVIVISEPVDPATVNPNGIRLRLGTDAVAGSLVLDPSGMLVRFTPDSPLLPNAHYQLDITQALTDLTGAPLEVPTTVSFTTGAAPGSPVSVTVTPPVTEVLSAYSGSSLRETQLAATVRDLSGAAVSARVSWSSSDPTVALVDSLGRVLGMAPGSATIAATVDAIQDTATITVLDPFATILVQPPSATVQIGETICLAATPAGGSGAVSGYQIDWQLPATLSRVSNQANVVCVRAVAPGHENIYVRANPPHASWTLLPVWVSVLVVAPIPVASVSVTPDSARVLPLQTGGDVLLRATVREASGKEIPSVPVSWNSSNPSVATVSGIYIAAGGSPLVPHGRVRYAGGNLGSITVTATAGGRSSSVTVRVDYARFAMVAAGAGDFALTPTCLLDSDSTAYCFGYNNYGQLGLGSRARGDRFEPAAVAGGYKFVGIAVGGDGHACGITRSAELYCWGLNRDGALGVEGGGTCADDGVPQSPMYCSLAPVRVPGDLALAEISAGYRYFCGLTTSGVAYCWGSNQYGQLGTGTTLDAASPVAVAGGLSFRHIASAAWHACGLNADGTAYCWGFNGAGQLGDGTTTNRALPVAVSGGLRFAQLTTGGAHTCGLTTSGTAYCWGQAEQLGNGSSSDALEPSLVTLPGGVTLTTLSAGALGTCGLNSLGMAYCWGTYLDRDDTILTSPVVPVPGGLTFQSINTGWLYSCGVTTSQLAYCWDQYFSMVSNPSKVPGQP